MSFVSDTISNVGKAISSSPIAQAAITVGGSFVGVPPAVTAAILGANQASQTGDIGQGLMTGGLSYLGGDYLSSAPGESMFAQYAPTWMGGNPATGAMGGGTGLTLGGGTQGLTAGGATAVGMGGGTGVSLGGAAASGSSTGLGSMWNTITSNPQLLSAGLGLAGSYLNANQAQQAASNTADAQVRAAQIAADAAKFRPVGVTTNFGASRFGYDPNGNLVSAGYAMNPLLQGQQNQLLGTSQGLLNQFSDSQTATAPMGQAAQTMMQLGQGYLATTPQEQAAKYMTEQQSLLAPGRAATMADLQSKMQAQGRGGFAIGGGVNGQLAANPQLQALYNAQLQQDAQLAAQATQGGMDYAKFGAGAVGTGGDLLSSMYGTQVNAFSPYKTALGGAQTIEGLGQNAMDLGVNIGAKGTASALQSGLLTSQGITNAAQTMQPSNAYSPWGNLLSGLGNVAQNYQWGK